MDTRIKELRLKNNGITNHFSCAYECISALHGIQAQYDLYAYISLINRVENLEIDELFGDEAIVKSWGQRVTLHINTKENMMVNKAVFSSRNNWIKKYISQLGGKCGEIVSQIVNADYESNSFSKLDVRNNIQHKERDQMMQWGGVLAQASIEGYIYEVLDNHKGKKYAKLESELLDKKMSYEQAIQNLIDKFVVAFGPVSLRDFAHWSGLSKSYFEKYWKMSTSKYEQLRVEGEVYYYRNDGTEDKSDNIILLGKFDPLLLAYYDKTWLVDKRHVHKIWKSAGHVEGILLVDNMFTGTWHCNKKNSKLCFYVKSEYQISKKTMDEVDKRLQYISRVLEKQYGGVTIENEDTLK